jgi:hypothetical protein
MSRIRKIGFPQRERDHHFLDEIPMPRDTPAAPTTQAGRDLVGRMMILFRAQHESVEAFVADILAIEAEARSTPAEALDATAHDHNVHDCQDCFEMASEVLRGAPLDVERLADFIRDRIESEPYQGLHSELASMGLAIAIRDEFLRSPESDR